VVDAAPLDTVNPERVNMLRTMCATCSRVRWGAATRVLALFGLVAVAACSGAGGSTEPTEVRATSSPVEVEPQGFSTIAARITKANGEVCDVCLWLADSAEERRRGLMGVTDLGEPVGMAFLFDEARSGSFFMFRTPTPLSIAWFDVDGSIVGMTDMAPCLDTPPADCPRYSPGSSYQLAVETFLEGHTNLGIEEGSSVQLLAGTESPACLLAT